MGIRPRELIFAIDRRQKGTTVSSRLYPTPLDCLPVTGLSLRRPSFDLVPNVMPRVLSIAGMGVPLAGPAYAEID